MTKEYIEREAALNELIEELEMNTPMCTKEQNAYIDLGLKIAIKDIQRMTSSDVVEVVRCKDCDYRDGLEDLCGNIYCRLHDGRFDKDGYCSYGKRRAEE